MTSAPATRKYCIQNDLRAYHVWGLNLAGDAPTTYTRYPERGTIKPSLFARSIICLGPVARSAGMLKLADSFIMSENIQIIFEMSEVPLDPDSRDVLSCHRPPIMSVPAAVGESPADLVLKPTTSWCRAWSRSSVNTPWASGVQPLSRVRTLPNDSGVMTETQIREFGGSVRSSFFTDKRYSRKSCSFAPPLPIEPLTSMRMPSWRVIVWAKIGDAARHSTISSRIGKT